MSLQEYLQDPWKREKSHKSYADSAFGMRTAPEFATGEVVVSSLYRAIGFGGFGENMVNAAGRELENKYKGTAKAPAESVSNDTWQTILHGVLASPTQSNQSSRRSLQMCPLIPDVNLYSGSARLSGNPWNPGTLLQRIIQMGCKSIEDANELWAELFAALSVGDQDDAWARWLQEEFGRRKLNGKAWGATLLKEESNDLSNEDKRAHKFPAQQFVSDLKSVIAAKEAMTRRQWISLFEAVIRIGAVSHVLWLCGVSTSLWLLAQQVLAGHDGPQSIEATSEALYGSKTHYISYGNLVLPTLRNIASGYLAARLGLNTLLWHLEELGIAVPALNSASDVYNLLETLKSNRERLVTAGALRDFHKLVDEHPRSLACKKGIGSNLLEFCRYSLGKRQTAEATLRSYDQSYFLNKRGSAKSAPWVVSFGPVALLAIVHCCLREFSGPRSVKHFSHHMGLYGMSVSVDDIGTSQLGKELRMLGLILDSPDAESGILLVPPFNIARTRI
jgi:hypothetical protein